MPFPLVEPTGIGITDDQAADHLELHSREIRSRDPAMARDVMRWAQQIRDGYAGPAAILSYTGTPSPSTLADVTLLDPTISEPAFTEVNFTEATW